jgi:hypothetical protein
LNRPLETRAGYTQFAPARAAEPSAVEAAPVSVQPLWTPLTQVSENPLWTPANTLSIPTITIVSKGPRRSVAPKVVSEAQPDPSESLPDIAQMHCAEWRELDMGSGHVQVCE